MSAKNQIFVVLIVVLLISGVTCGLIRDRRAVEDYWYSHQVLNNMVSDNIVGGPTSRQIIITYLFFTYFCSVTYLDHYLP
uniref:Uncharacterized protein n=1 Tax=Caenorhabditis japonica TaxID=281687 RepID=A0A8R1HNR1_CAEJA